MRPKLIFSAVAMLACVASLRAQTSDDTIRVDTRLVSVPVIVSDRDGRYVPHLQQSDFRVFQDGTEQPIAFFGATEESITVGILIDTSHSTRPVLDDIKDSARSFIKLLTQQDRAMVVSFDNDTHILSPLTNDQKQLADAIKHAEIPDDPGTTLRDAVYQTITNSFKGINGRKAIIVLTDGKDAGSYIRANDLLYRLEESDTLVYTIMFQTGGQRPRDRGMGPGVFRGGFPGMGGGRFPGGGFPRGGRGGGPQDGERRKRMEERQKQQNEQAGIFLKNLSDTTAGRFFSSKDGKLKKTFAEIMEELRFQYRLGFYPPDEDRPGSHQLRVRVSKENAVVRARGAYRAERK